MQAYRLSSPWSCRHSFTSYRFLVCYLIKSWTLGENGFWWIASSTDVSTRAPSSCSSKVLILISITYPVPNLCLICYALPKHLKIPPLTMIPILVLSASASSILWVVNTTALVFFYAILPTTDHMKRLDSGSIPADGSSKKIIGGLPIIANATHNFRLLPPESVPDGLVLCMPKPN